MNVGDIAPNFTLKNQLSQDISLSDINQNVILLFFPFAFSSVCTSEMCKVRDDLKRFIDLNAKVFGISVDSHYTLKAWAEHLKINFDLLSDFNKVVSKLYNSFDEAFYPSKYNYLGVSKRSAVIIDKDKKIKYFKVCTEPDEEPNYEEIKDVLGQLS